MEVSGLNNSRIMSFETKYITIILCILAAEFVGGAHRSNHTKESLDTLFEKRELPRSGDIPTLNRKMFRGMRVSIAEHPYMVSVRRLTAHYVTGALLTKNLAVTVAHPLYKVSILELGLVVGENYADRGSTILTVVFMLFHEDFNPYRLVADMVLLRIFEDITYKVAVKPITLASWISTLEGHTAFVTGWGRCDRLGTELCLPKTVRYYRTDKLDPMLRSIKFTLSRSHHCQEYYQHDMKMDNRTLCVGPARADDILCPCMAVPGAPLVVDGKLAGLQSWGFGCGYLRDLPLVYTNLEAYHGWLLHNIPIIKSITKADLTDLYAATKVKKITEWLHESRIRLVRAKLVHSYEIQVQPVDHKLAKLRGDIYDVRDFIDDGKYRESKILMYQSLTIAELKAEVIKEIGLRNRVKGVPFLNSKDVERDGLVLNNGNLTEDTLSDESDDDYDYDEDLENKEAERDENLNKTLELVLSATSSADTDIVGYSQKINTIPDLPQLLPE